MVVVLNCTALAADHDGIDPDMESTLNDINKACTYIFMVECAIKLRGLGFRGYADDPFNLFDGFIVLISVIEFFLPEGGAGTSVFRALRILRVFKLSQSMENFRRVLIAIVNAVPELGNFFALLILFVFFFAVMGLHLFGGTLQPGDDNRSTFNTFPSALVCVFQVLTGENWNTLMYHVVDANGIASVAYFIILVIFGVYLMLNLFLAVLLLKTMNAFMPKRTIQALIKQRGKEFDAIDMEEEPPDEYQLIGKSLFILGPYNGLRRFLQKIIKHPLFDNFILVCILLSSIGLAVEEPGADEKLVNVLKTVDMIFLIIFTFEMTIKIVCLGFLFGSPYAYLKNPWNILDGVIVLLGWFIKLIPTGGDGENSDLDWVKTLRVVRALRPLRMIKRVPELKQVVNSLFEAAPTLGNVILLLVMFWMVFGILGINLFKGRFYYCTDGDVYGIDDCIGVYYDEDLGLQSRQWLKPGDGYWGFDNIGEALVTLFEVSTLEMWLDIMYYGADSVDVGMQGVLDQNPLAYIYFIVFVFLGSFFLMQLFVGAIVTSYFVLNEKAAGQAFQSERQQREVAQRVLRQGVTPFIPIYNWQNGLHNLMENEIVENGVMACIVLNIMVMALSFD
eukprot:SAG31_NODE_6550_length_1981_cov_1.388417_2_plen_618_part_01